MSENLTSEVSNQNNISTTKSNNHEDKTELNDLLKQLNLTIINLEKKRKNILEQINEIVESPKTEENKSKLQHLQDVLNAFDTKIKEAYATQDNLNQFEKESQVAFQLAQDQLESPDRRPDDGIKLNEEGLPFMDIQEEVDENGNVINSKINNVAINDKDNISDYESPLKKKKSDQITETTSDEKLKEKISRNDNELKQLFHDMEVNPSKQHQRLQENYLNQDELLDKIDQLQISPEEKFNLKRICVEAFKDYNEDEHQDLKSKQPIEKSSTSTQSNIKYPSGLDRNNLLELELLADDMDQDEEMKTSDNDEDFDYDFDDDEDDEGDEDDYADQLLYGNNQNSPWIGKDNVHNQSNKMLYDQIMNLRGNKDKQDTSNGNTIEELNEKTPTQDKKSKKSVRFSNNLDIKDIENVSEELKKSELLNTRKSLFKQNRLRNGTNKTQDEDIIETDNQNYVNKAVEDTIVEKDLIDDDERITNDIVDKIDDGDKIQEDEIVESKSNEDILESPKKPISRFKALKQQRVNNEKSMPVHNFKISDLNNNKPKEEKAIGNLANNENDIQDIPNNQQHVRDTTLDYQNLNKDLDTMAKAYVMGMYDDDLEHNGVLIENLKDFDTVNKLVEERDKSKAKTSKSNSGSSNDKIEEYDSKSNEIGMDIDDYENNDIDETKIMTDDIIENDLDDIHNEEEELENNEDYNFNSDILNKEIKQDYNKLKQKINQQQFKNEENKEFEPIDEFGNTVKISRFKANNQNHRFN
ncbi:hypothetical protein KGF54_000784 [Candida jiufengensis]|uniref:uncharacterized protein n=1 Tax=Candida jiufengensis TaxID=497108 RepID=UPI0022257152|nr:uncharacterized protein KGF54_000784 [Candida jiufengensis]KAI5956309.1 hypothetical protein KGF54_000784 [Candida jiufengensis]